jgi:hypothetical protein
MFEAHDDEVEIAPGLLAALEQLVQEIPQLDLAEQEELRDLMLLRIRATIRIGASRMAEAERRRLDMLIARAGLPPIDWRGPATT